MRPGPDTHTALWRHRSANQQTAAASQQAASQQQYNLQRYEHAYGACMGGRNYEVK